MASACADAIVHGEWEQDTHPFLAEIHFDDCNIEQGIAYLRTEVAAGEVEAIDGHQMLALAHLGHVLHSLEDFYAHSNFVELAAAGPETTSPHLRLWDVSSDAILAPYRSQLFSGTFLLSTPNRCKSGAITHREMNKDGPSSKRGGAPIASWQMTYYRAAADMTKVAVGTFLKETLNKPAWDSVIKKCGQDYGFSWTLDNRKD